MIGYGNRRFNAANTDTLSVYSPAKVTNPTIQTSNNRFLENEDDGSIDYDENGNLTLDAEDKVSLPIFIRKCSNSSLFNFPHK